MPVQCNTDATDCDVKQNLLMPVKLLMPRKVMPRTVKNRHKKALIPGIDPDGTRYLEYCERNSKTMDGTKKDDYRETVPRIYSNPDRDMLYYYDLFVTKRPKDTCQPDSPFFIKPLLHHTLKSSDKICYYKTPIKPAILESKLKNV